MTKKIPFIKDSPLLHAELVTKAVGSKVPFKIEGNTMKAIAAFVFILLCTIPGMLFSQLVKEKFDRMNLSENFDSTTTMWTMVANLDNLFIVQDGEYILNRKTLVSPFAIVAGYNNEASSFRIVSSIKLEKTVNDDGNVGLMFMAQNDGKGGFIFEINKFKQYRVKQLSGGSYKYISGDSKSNGWVKSNSLSDLNLYNLIDIRTANKSYDIFINNAFLMSFTEPSYSKGRLGIIIGPGSKARVDFIYVFINSNSVRNLDEAVSTQDNKATEPVKGTYEPDIIALAESIIQLKTQINKLNEENELLHQTIEAYKSDEKEALITQRNYERNLKTMQDEIKLQNVRLDSLTKVNGELLKYKELVAGNENADLIITLSKTVKSEKAANEELRRINKELNDSLAVMKNENLKSASQKGIKGVPVNQANKSNQDSTQQKGFTLPNDGN